MNLLDYPPFKKAVEEEYPKLVERRNQVFSDFCSTEILEWQVGFLTLKDVANLILNHNAFVNGTKPTIGDAIAFIRCVCIREIDTSEFYEYANDDKLQMILFAEINKYVRNQFEDAEGGEGEKSFFDSYSFIATHIDLLAYNYGWKPYEILDLPLVMIFQLYRIIAKRANPEYQPTPPLAEVKAEALRWINEQKHGGQN